MGCAYTIYEALGIKTKSDSKTIKKTCTQLKIKNHPDKGGSTDDFNKFTSLCSYLTDNKSTYDGALSSSFSKQSIHLKLTSDNNLKNAFCDVAEANSNQNNYYQHKSSSNNYKQSYEQQEYFTNTKFDTYWQACFTTYDWDLGFKFKRFKMSGSELESNKGFISAQSSAISGKLFISAKIPNMGCATAASFYGKANKLDIKSLSKYDNIEFTFQYSGSYEAPLIKQADDGYSKVWSIISQLKATESYNKKHFYEVYKLDSEKPIAQVHNAALLDAEYLSKFEDTLFFTHSIIE
jgi:hypothetical protein